MSIGPKDYNNYIRNIDKLPQYLDQPTRDATTHKALSCSCKRFIKDLFTVLARICNSLFGDHQYYSTKNIRKFVQQYAADNNRNPEIFVKMQDLLNRLNLIGKGSQTFATGITLTTSSAAATTPVINNVENLQKPIVSNPNSSQEHVTTETSVPKTANTQKQEVTTSPKTENDQTLAARAPSNTESTQTLVTTAPSKTENSQKQDATATKTENTQKQEVTKVDGAITNKPAEVQLLAQKGAEEQPMVSLNGSLNSAEGPQAKPEPPIPQDFTLELIGKDLKIGDIVVPIATARDCWLYAEGNSIIVHLDTARGGFYEVSLHLELQNKQKVKECLQLLYSLPKMQFTVPTIRDVKPDSNDVKLTFDNWKDAEIFLNNYASFFFPESEYEHSFDQQTKVLKFTHRESGDKLDQIQKALQQLNARLYGKVIENLLYKNNDPRFPGKRNVEVRGACWSISDSQKYQNSYEITPKSIRMSYFDSQMRKQYFESDTESIRNFVYQKSDKQIEALISDENRWLKLMDLLQQTKDKELIEKGQKVMQFIKVVPDFAKKLLAAKIGEPNPYETEIKLFQEIMDNPKTEAHFKSCFAELSPDYEEI